MDFNTLQASPIGASGKGDTIDQRTPTMTGGCQCGAVRYALLSEPTGANICHCRMCLSKRKGPKTAPG